MVVIITAWLATAAGVAVGWALRQATVRSHIAELEEMAERRCQIAEAAVASLVLTVDDELASGKSVPSARRLLAQRN